jgi:hypothetical protein
MGMKGAQHAHEASSPSTPRRGPDARDADAARVGRLLARTDATRAVAREVLKNDIVLAMECVARRTRAVCDMLDRRPLARASSPGLTSLRASVTKQKQFNFTTVKYGSGTDDLNRQDVHTTCACVARFHARWMMFRSRKSCRRLLKAYSEAP